MQAWGMRNCEPLSLSPSSAIKDFVYPNNVAYPIGGPGNAQYVVMEMHYDNPTFDMGESVSCL